MTGRLSAVSLFVFLGTLPGMGFGQPTDGTQLPSDRATLAVKTGFLDLDNDFQSSPEKVVLVQAPANAETQPANADRRYALIGEFDLLRETLGVKTERYGMQITCLGEDRFQGFLYKGGLPGVGGDYANKLPLKGTYADDQVELTGDGVTVRATAHEATLTFDNSEKKATPPKSITLQKVLRQSKTLWMAPPPNAIVLFDGKDSTELKNAKRTSDGYLQVGPETTKTFKAFHLHAEFRTPYMPRSAGQRRGNSGIYIQRRYEVQILDSFALDNLKDSGGAIYLQRKPDLNMCLPPLVWQTYDIDFHPPTWTPDGKKDKLATLLLVHNGVPVHYNNVITAKTGSGQPEGPEPLSILFQNHNDPVVFRNIWIIPMDEPTSGTGPNGTAGKKDPTSRSVTDLSTRN